MIGQLLAGHTQIIGKLRRIPRPVLQCHQHPGTGLIRQRMPETRQHRHITHDVHEMIVHLNLNSRISEPSRAARAPTPEHEQGKDRPALERAARGCPRIPGTTWDESYQVGANGVDRVLPLRGEDHSVSDHFREGSIGGRVRCRRRRCLQRREEAQDKTPVRKAAVCATEVSLRAARRVEVHAESARLAVSDVVAEFRDRLGEEVPPPGGIRDRPRTLALCFDDRTDMPTLTEAHPYARIYLFLPGLGVILGTRVLGEFGDDANR